MPLGKKRVALAIHDSCFPGDPGEDVGRGSPYDRGARRIFELAAELGFDAIQLGPQGQTSLDNPSPYDASIFSRNQQSIALMPLVEEGLIDRDAIESAVAASDRSYRYAYLAKQSLLKSIPDLEAIAERQHAELRSFCAKLGLSLYGDMQVGLPPEDRERLGHLFLADWSMGAPPSRTNPEGQPWGYPVIDPDRRDAGREFFEMRVDRMNRFYDGIRIDHPHGIVCPWVYRDSVMRGARLYDSPDHPELGRHAIAREEQIDRSAAPWADDRVRSLDPDQIARYAELFDVIVSRANLVICEVLSTMPHPLRRVLERHGLGRFRVTQKANLDDPTDVYRSENARPEDWIMVGTHDTKPIWLLAKEWQASGEAKRQGDYLARRLRPQAEPRIQEQFATEIASDRSLLVHAKFADIFLSEAENVMIFFADLFGLEEIYNRPGIIHPENWMLRLPRQARPALDLQRVLALKHAARSP